MLKRKQQDGSKSRRTKTKNKKVKTGPAEQKRAPESTFVTLGMAEKDEVELRLEERVFGGVADVIGRLTSHHDQAGDSEAETDSHAEDAADEGDAGQRRPAWQDDDDAMSMETAFRAQGRRPVDVDKPRSFSKMLRRKFESVVGTPKWASLEREDKGSESDAESGDELLQRCGRLVLKKEGALGSDAISIARTKDLNVQTYAEGPIIKATQFHPTASVGLVAGLAGVTSLFQVDGQTNNKLHSVKFERFPVTCARFTRDGAQFLVGSPRHPYLYCHDLMSGKTSRFQPSASDTITNMKSFEMSPDGRLMAACGRWGHVHVMTVRSKELVASLKMDGSVTALAFSPDGSQLYTHGDCGEVYVWDVSSRTCCHRFLDDGCISACSLAASPSGRLLACGARSGVVNLYETATAMSSPAPRPSKIFLNLTTAATSLKFDNSSQLLAMASSDKDNAVRLAHVESLTVYSNFPRAKAKVFRAQCLDFSLNSGFFVVGNNKNAALLYRSACFNKQAH